MLPIFFSPSLDENLQRLLTTNCNLEAEVAKLNSQIDQLRAQLEAQESKMQLEDDNSSSGISDLKVENAELKSLVASLECEIERIRDSTHQQRIRALDLKHELREVSSLKRLLSIVWLSSNYSSASLVMKLRII
jgi:ABC-type phosphate transport system auxiliary subunit